MDNIQMDPVTLRALAADLDREGDDWRSRCRCQLHVLLARLADDRAADYRTRAIKAEQAPAQAGGP